MKRPVSRLRLESLERRIVPASPAAAPSLGPPPAASSSVTWVSTTSQLQNAVQNLQSNRTIVIQPGTYQLTSPLVIGNSGQISNVLIRGATDNYSDVVIRGAGMDNNQVWFGFSLYNAQDVTIANVSIGQVYYSAVEIHGEVGAARINLYHNRLFDTGEQMIKSNPGTGTGANDCKVEYCLVEYTNGPSTVDHGPGVGYTNGISAHTVNGWQIRHNLWRNFHTPDNSAYPWNPVILVWNYSQNTLVEGNTFINSDRAIALGLTDRAGGFDHQGGIVRNNFIYQQPGLFSAARRNSSDGQILVYDSPGTQVYHNTIITSGNSAFAIEVRWSNSGVVLANNLADAPVRGRDGGTYTASGNYLSATAAMFTNPASADFHIVSNTATLANVINRGAVFASATTDFDLGARPMGGALDVGADEYVPAAAPVRVQSVQVNDGTAQRSRVTSLTLTFDAQVTFGSTPAAAFTLVRNSDGAGITFSATAAVVGGVTVVTLNGFSGAATQSGSLADGRYTLTALSGQISSGGQALDGDGNGTAGGNYAFGDSQGLFRFFGDLNGDRRIDISDFGSFSTAYNKTAPDPAYNPIFDFNNDGRIDISDFGQFSVRFFTNLP